VRIIRHEQSYPTPKLIGDLAMDLLKLVWPLIRLPIATCLVILHPVVRVALGGLALLGVLMSSFFELSGAAPNFPFLVMLAISAGFGFALIGYEWAIRYFSR
jgi:hypothetical protein